MKEKAKMNVTQIQNYVFNLKCSHFNIKSILNLLDVWHCDVWHWKGTSVVIFIRKQMRGARTGRYYSREEEIKVAEGWYRTHELVKNSEIGEEGGSKCFDN